MRRIVAILLVGCLLQQSTLSAATFVIPCGTLKDIHHQDEPIYESQSLAAVACWPHQILPVLTHPTIQHLLAITHTVKFPSLHFQGFLLSFGAGILGTFESKQGTSSTQKLAKMIKRTHPHLGLGMEVDVNGLGRSHVVDYVLKSVNHSQQIFVVLRLNHKDTLLRVTPNDDRLIIPGSRAASEKMEDASPPPAPKPRAKPKLLNRQDIHKELLDFMSEAKARGATKRETLEQLAGHYASVDEYFLKRVMSNINEAPQRSLLRIRRAILLTKERWSLFRATRRSQSARQSA